MLALIGNVAKGANAAGKVKSATKMLPGRKKGGALDKTERPGFSQFYDQAQQKASVAAPTLDKSSFFSAPKIDKAKKGKTNVKSAENKIDLITKFIKKGNQKRKQAFNSYLKDKQDKKRKDKEEKKENFAKGIAKGIAAKALAPVKSIFDRILDAVGKIIIAKIAMWAIDNPEAFANTLKGLAATADFIVDAFITIVDIFAGLIEFGYDLVDGFNDWIEGTFGEDVAKVMDDLGPTVLAFLNAALAVGTALLALKALKPKPKPDPPKVKKPRKPGDGPDPDINARKRGGVTTSGGKRTGFRGKIDEVLDKNPFRKKPKVTGADDFFSKTSRKVNQFNPFAGGAKSVTVTGGKRTGLGGIQDAIADANPLKKKPTITGGKKPGFFDNLNPFKKKPKITGTGAPSFMDRLKNIGSGALDLGKKGVKKLEEGTEIVLEQTGRFGRFVSKQYKKVTAGLSEWAEKNSPKLTSVLEWLSERKGALGKFAKKAKPVLQKLGKYLPFIGDAVGFGMDLIGGVDWRRALIRAVTGIGIDAGFTALMGALGVAVPFTGGASGVLATTLYLAYMGADIAAGGFGRILGDKISDAFGIPMMAGEKPFAEPKLAGGDGDVKKLQETMKKKAEEDPEFAKKIGAISTTDPKVTIPVTPTPQGGTDKPKPTDATPTVYPQDKLVPKGKASSNIQGTNEEKWKAFYAMAQKAGAKYPNLLAAQFALESGWGTALAAKNNFFGIKATGSESSTVSNTREVINGKTVYMNEPFKNFDTPQDAVNHLVTQWYKDYRGYKGVNNAPDAFAAADQLRAEGYATDPVYSQSLKRLLTQYAGIEGSEGDIQNIPSDVARTATPDNTPTPAQIPSTGSTPSSPSVAAVPTLNSGNGPGVSGGSGSAKPQAGDQAIIPVSLPSPQAPSGQGKTVSARASQASLNSLYKAQLYGFLYKQG
tara:strand:- start:18986 stop:21790 length:2805 start_codon:yes stop_codon:yes gene_type:complete